jgi:hypothetical protein
MKAAKWIGSVQAKKLASFKVVEENVEIPVLCSNPVFLMLCAKFMTAYL